MSNFSSYGCMASRRGACGAAYYPTQYVRPHLAAAYPERLGLCAARFGRTIVRLSLDSEAGSSLREGAAGAAVAKSTEATAAADPAPLLTTAPAAIYQASNSPTHTSPASTGSRLILCTRPLGSA